jgi:hypothetical protein
MRANIDKSWPKKGQKGVKWVKNDLFALFSPPVGLLYPSILADVCAVCGVWEKKERMV